MTDTEPETTDAEVVEAASEPAHCRHCGQPAPDDVDVAATPDWLCPVCEHYQDTMACPTCGQPARISLLPAELVPEVHAPTRRRRVKE